MTPCTLTLFYALYFTKHSNSCELVSHQFFNRVIAASDNFQAYSACCAGVAVGVMSFIIKNVYDFFVIYPCVRSRYHSDTPNAAYSSKVVISIKRGRLIQCLLPHLRYPIFSNSAFSSLSFSVRAAKSVSEDRFNPVNVPLASRIGSTSITPSSKKNELRCPPLTVISETAHHLSPHRKSGLFSHHKSFHKAHRRDIASATSSRRIFSSCICSSAESSSPFSVSLSRHRCVCCWGSGRDLFGKSLSSTF